MVPQADQLYRICCCMGSPTEETWPGGLQLAAAMRFSLPACSPIPLGKLVRASWCQKNCRLQCNSGLVAFSLQFGPSQMH